MLARHRLFSNRGFTIVELLVVIVVIAILAAVATVAYTGVITRAEESKLQSDLNNAIKLVSADKAINGTTPASLSAVNDNKGVPTSQGTFLEYSTANGHFCISATSTTRQAKPYFYSSETGQITEGSVCPGHQEPATGPVTDPVVYTQTGSFNSGNSSYTNGIDYPVTINYDIRPTDYVFVLFNANYTTTVAVQDASANNFTKLFEKSLGASGYQKNVAFGRGGITGPQQFNIHACNTFGYGCSGTSSYTLGLSASYIVYVIRGLTASPVVANTSTTYDIQARGVTVAPAAQTLGRGKLAIFSRVTYSSYAPTFADGSNPALSWTVDSNVPNSTARSPVSSWHAYAQTSGTAQYQMITSATTGGANYHGTVLFTFN